jgi:subtilisin-like proprotein convertase family protein
MFTNPNGGSRILKFKTHHRALLALVLAVSTLAGTTKFAAPVSADSSTTPKARSGVTKSQTAPPAKATNAAAAAALFFAPTTFSNSTSISVPAGQPGTTVGASTPYPSNITVSGLVGTITDVNVTLTGISHSNQADIDVLLVGPNGEKFTLMSDTGQSGVAGSINLTFDDAAASFLPNSAAGPDVTGTFKPTDYDGSTGTLDDIAWPAPAPAAPYAEPGPNGGTDTLASVFSGHNANGTWSLYVADDASSDFGSISGGWSVTIDTAATAVGTTTTVSGSPNPALRNQAVTFTSTTVVTSSNAPVNAGTVNFTENNVNLTCTEGAQPRTVNASGQATCTVAANGFTEGNHIIVATYNGTVNFATSNGNTTEVVDNPTTVAGNTFCNTGLINVPVSAGAATPYPSHIFPTGLSGSISKVTIDLKGLTHTNPDDLDILLVGPGGTTKVILMSDAGGTADVSNINLNFDDAAATAISDTGPLATGSFKPADYAPADTLPAPAPAGPYGTVLSAYNGATPNGTWSLYVFDDGSGADAGQITNGWCANFTTTTDAPTTTTVSGSPNPSLTTQSVTFTSTTLKTSDSTPATSGTVSFHEGATALTCTEGAQPRTVNASGQATCTVAGGTFSEGDHLITADYNGSPGQFNTSSGSTTQIVDNPTTINPGNEFCNTGSIAVPAPSPSPAPSGAAARPYPSHINVTGLGGTITHLTVALNGITHTNPDDLDVLLVGPNGQKIILMSDAGGSTDVSGVNLTFDDAAASSLPDSGTLTTGTFKPTNFTGIDADAFPAPAPSGPYGSALSDFNTTTPNGTWSLYVTDDAGGDIGTIANGWCLTFTLTNPSSVTVSDSSAKEPTSGSSNMVFTVLANPAPNSGMDVTFTTEPDPLGANPATAGSDYTTTSGTVHFNAGQSLQTITVPILPDASNEPPETFILHLTGLTGGDPGSSITDDKATGTILDASTATPPAQLLISELRSSGPTSVDNDFVEIYNNSNSAFTVPAGGYALFKSGASCLADPNLLGTIPAGTLIKAHGHYLFVGSAYALASYAAGDKPLASNLQNDRNVGLFTTTVVANLSSATRLDAVGFGTNTGNNCDLLREGSTVAATSGSTSEYTVVRDLSTGFSKDTDDNASDFYVAATNPTVAVGSTATPRLGAPGPENLASPVLRSNAEIQSLLVAAVPDSSSPNRTRDASSYTDTLTPSAPNGGAPATNPYTLGTLSIQRRFVNNTGAPVTRLRFRVVSITGTNAPNLNLGGAQADIRLLSSDGVTRAPTVPGFTFRGLTLEQPPTQAFGGGWNSSATVNLAVLPGGNLGTGQAVDVQFLIGVAGSGKFAFFVIVEALP